MYIGSTGLRGLHHLVYEVVDNSVDEALQGHCDHITVTIAPDTRVTVTDNGRGIPVAVMEGIGLSAAEVVLTKLHAGGKFGGGGYKVSGGLHGVGISVVNALSESLDLEIRRDGHVWRQSYERGDPVGPLTQGEEASDTGTIITFLPDGDIFEATDYSFETLAQRLREMAFLTRGLRIELTDERAGGEKADFQFEGGIADFILYVNDGKDSVHKDVVYFESETDEGQLEVAMQWNGSYVESTYSFANNINTHEGGTHLSGFKSSLTRTLNDYARAKGLLKEKEEPLTGDDCREGLAAIVSVKLREPQFEGQTKTKLGNPSIRGLVETICNAKLGGVPRGASRRGAGDREQADRRQPGAPGCAEGTRPDPAKDGARRRRPAGQAGRLHRPRPARGRALPRRGRLRRRERGRRPRPPVPGDPPAARQDHQRREGTHQQGALQQRDPGHDHRDRHGHRRGVQDRGGPLPQGRRHLRRRSRRCPHPHAHPDVPLQAHEGADRGGLRLHRPAAALQAARRLRRPLLREGAPARGVADPRAARQDRDPGSRRHRGAPHRDAAPAAPARGARVRGLGVQAQGALRSRRGQLREGPSPDRAAHREPRRPRRPTSRRRCPTTSRTASR